MNKYNRRPQKGKMIKTKKVPQAQANTGDQDGHIEITNSDLNLGHSSKLMKLDLNIKVFRLRVFVYLGAIKPYIIKMFVYQIRTKIL